MLGGEVSVGFSLGKFSVTNYSYKKAYDAFRLRVADGVPVAHWPSVMAGAVDIQAFLTSLAGPDLKVARDSLKLTHLWRFFQTPGFASEALSKHKQPCRTFKIWERRNEERAFVVKFSPPKNRDMWTNVIQEYKILSGLPSGIPAPHAVYASSASDEATVGRSFVIMEFVPGISYASASEVPPDKRTKVCTSAMQAMAKVHQFSRMKESRSSCFFLWQKYSVKADFVDCREFWWHQVSAWDKIHSNCGPCGPDDKVIDELFVALRKKIPPPNGDTGIIHGDMKLSSFIFDKECNVKAIVGWKSTQNGDPLVDVASFLAMFLQPVDYGYHYLQDLDLFMGYPNSYTPSEEQMLAVYSTEAKRYGIPFSKKALNYAKAVTCLRLIAFVQAAWRDRWSGHAIGQYKVVRNHPEDVITMLTKAGYSFCELI